MTCEATPDATGLPPRQQTVGERVHDVAGVEGGPGALTGERDCCPAGAAGKPRRPRAAVHPRHVLPGGEALIRSLSGGQPPILDGIDALYHRIAER